MTPTQEILCEIGHQHDFSDYYTLNLGKPLNRDKTPAPHWDPERPAHVKQVGNLATLIEKATLQGVAMNEAALALGLSKERARGVLAFRLREAGEDWVPLARKVGFKSAAEARTGALAVFGGRFPR